MYISRTRITLTNKRKLHLWYMVHMENLLLKQMLQRYNMLK